jgi:pimeloyl-ACP methyl ester carboxylesterase
MENYFSLIGVFLLAIAVIIQPSFNLRMVWAQTENQPTSTSSTAKSTSDFTYPIVISTRGNFNNNTGELLPNHTSTDYNAINIPGLKNDKQHCPRELAIFVHGAWVDGTKTGYENALEIFNRTKMSLEKNNYTHPLAGYSWDSNTTKFQIKTNGWIALKLIAKENGPKLAQFILDFMNKCANQGSKVRLIAHSLGARVVLSTLDSLNNNQQWTSNRFKIASVHLIGAAVDDEEVSKNPFYIVKNPQPNMSSILDSSPSNVSAAILNDLKEWYNVYGIKSAYGKAIENIVDKFYNLYSSNDALLIILYKAAELETPLGLTGAQVGIPLPSNYYERNVANIIPAICDANGDGNVDGPFYFTPNYNIMRGENHAGYYGIRNATNATMLIDSGAINTIVRDWNSTLADEKNISKISDKAVCK